MARSPLSLRGQIGLDGLHELHRSAHLLFDALVVLGVEQLARAREIEELFALSLSDRFFLSLGYNVVSISRYPEKLARYEKLKADGVNIVPKRCFQKLLTDAPAIVSEAAPETESAPARKLRIG
jgi:hypothetical protein